MGRGDELIELVLTQGPSDAAGDLLTEISAATRK